MHGDPRFRAGGLSGALHLVIADLRQIDRLDGFIIPDHFAVIEHAVGETYRHHGRQVDRLGVLVDGLFERLSRTGCLRIRVGTHADDCLRSGKSAGDDAGYREFRVGCQLFVGHLAPSDGQITTGAVGVGGADGGRQRKIGRLGAGLDHAVHIAHTHRIEGIRLEFADAHIGALREHHAKLAGLNRFGELHFVALVLHNGVGLSARKLDVLPVSFGIGILQLPGLDHRHTAMVGPEVQLRLLERHGAGPFQLQGGILAGVVVPVVPGFVRCVAIHDLAVDDLLGVVLRLPHVGVACGRGRLRSHVDRSVGRNAVHGDQLLAGLLAVGCGEFEHVVAFPVEGDGGAGGLLVDEIRDTVLRTGNLFPLRGDLTVRQAVVLYGADDLRSGGRAARYVCVDFRSRVGRLFGRLDAGVVRLNLLDAHGHSRLRGERGTDGLGVHRIELHAVVVRARIRGRTNLVRQRPPFSVFVLEFQRIYGWLAVAGDRLAGGCLVEVETNVVNGLHAVLELDGD